MLPILEYRYVHIFHVYGHIDMAILEYQLVLHTYCNTGIAIAASSCYCNITGSCYRYCNSMVSQNIPMDTYTHSSTYSSSTRVLYRVGSVVE